MPLSSGTRLGPYEIVSALGAGGMGEVYRAKDTRLGRTVAIKILPQGLADTPEIRQRFEREARAISSLNHPHICALYDVGRHEGINYLVMEYLEGETLAERLEKGPLPTVEMLRYSMQMADALDKAHRQGVLHRDLKPGNVMLTKAGAKLLDFGLAKSAAVLEGDIGTSPTVSRPLTAQGTIVGTMQYMSPEQLEGKEADTRSDIFAFGTVLYEMATAKKAFEGKSQASLIAAILKEEPRPMRELQPMTPRVLERVVKTCLAKDPDERFQNAHDVKMELNWIAESSGVSEPSKSGGEKATPRQKAVRMIMAAGLVVLVGIGAWFAAQWNMNKEAGVGEVVEFAVTLPEKMSVSLSLNGGLALSPDGRMIAFVAKEGDGGPKLAVRRLDSVEVKPVPGTEGASSPFWSPDGAAIGFFADGQLKRVDLNSNSVRNLSEAPDGRGGTWNREGIILFAGSTNSPLSRISAEGGRAERITELGQAVSHRWPFFLSDGRHFLYTVPESPENAGVYLASLDAPKGVRISSLPVNGFVAGDYLLLVRNTSIIAQKIDVGKAKLEGEPTVILDRAGATNERHYSPFSVSQTGVLAYTPGGQRTYQLKWFDRTGKELSSLGPRESFDELDLSRDGKRLITDRYTSGVRTIWMMDLERGTLVPVDRRSSGQPVWAPDGRSVVFNSTSSTTSNYRILRKWIDGSEREETLLSSKDGIFPDDWSRDGKWLLYEHYTTPTNVDLFLLPMEGDRTPQGYLQLPGNEAHARISPDGRWVAYSSDESGRPEVYVQSFPKTGSGKWQISARGGDEPYWRGDGRELYFLSPDLKLMSVDIKLGQKLEPGIPRVLFQTSADESSLFSVRNQYVPSSDGQKFLVETLAQEKGQTSMIVRLNWMKALRKQNAPNR